MAAACVKGWNPHSPRLVEPSTMQRGVIIGLLYVEDCAHVYVYTKLLENSGKSKLATALTLRFLYGRHVSRRPHSIER